MHAVYHIQDVLSCALCQILEPIIPGFLLSPANSELPLQSAEDFEFAMCSFSLSLYVQGLLAQVLLLAIPVPVDHHHQFAA